NERKRWQGNPEWQATRRAIELALTTYDWAEAFTAVNLVLAPTLEDVWLRQFAELARAHGDEQTWLLLSNLRHDAQRCRRWSAQLVRYALAQRAENAAVLQRWIAVWSPRADAAVEALAPLLVTPTAPPFSASRICRQAREARESLWLESGLVLERSE
ncbi:MAG TPA: hypothetical protein VMF89_21505, partial [Polyangiales bacterium]|nr:hypothetical protein [Polyangiales bacterium]